MLNNTNANYSDIIRVLKNAQHVVFVMHQKPDGDTAGSALALAHYVESLGKQYTLYCADQLASYLQFLPKAHEIGAHEHVWQTHNFDTLVVVDCGDLKHAKVADKVAQLPNHITIVNIDHHITNQRYGHHNLVVSDASSASEIVYNILNEARALSKPIATALLTGIITDTGSFSNLATTASSVQAASNLLRYGASVNIISREVLQYRPFPTLKLWGRALDRLYEDSETHMIVTAITLQDVEELGVDAEAVGGISNFLNSLEEAATKAIMVLTQTKPGIVKASLRTTNALIDVAEFAKLYGGGGHKKAAGFTLNGTLTYSPDYGYNVIPTTTTGN